MPHGILLRLVHLSQQTYVPGTRLIPDHNDKGYGVLAGDDGREVYFSHDAVEHRRGFDLLRRGQALTYTLEAGPYLRAASVQAVVVASQLCPAA